MIQKICFVISSLGISLFSCGSWCQILEFTLRTSPASVRAGAPFDVVLTRTSCYDGPGIYELTQNTNELTVVHTVVPTPVSQGTCTEIANIGGLVAGTYRLEWIQVRSGDPFRALLGAINFNVLAQAPIPIPIPASSTWSLTLMAFFAALLGLRRARKTVVRKVENCS